MSLPATLAASLPAAVVETIVAGLAALFLAGAGGDMAAARHAACHMLAACHPRTEDELRLAANIVGFSFHALEALGQAAAPDMPLNRILRLRGSAVSLSRESAKAERRLALLQKAPRQSQPLKAPHSEPTQPEPRIERAIALIKDTGNIAETAKANGITWTQAHGNRQRDIRIAASLKRAEARIAALPAIPLPAALQDRRPIAEAT